MSTATREPTKDRLSCRSASPWVTRQTPQRHCCTKRVHANRLCTTRGAYALRLAGRSTFVALAPTALAVALSTLLCAGVASAEPQLSTSLTVGGGVREGRVVNGAAGPQAPGGATTADVSRETVRGAFHLGLWADAIFLRSRAKDIGLGPHLQLATTSFQNLDIGGGATLLVPLGSPAMTVNLGAYLRGWNGNGAAPAFSSGWGWTPGVSAAVFLGSKSYNFHGNYALSVGGVLQGKLGLTGDGARKHGEVTLALQVDLELVALPFLFLAEAVRGPRSK